MILVGDFENLFERSGEALHFVEQRLIVLQLLNLALLFVVVLIEPGVLLAEFTIGGFDSLDAFLELEIIGFCPLYFLNQEVVYCSQLESLSL